MNITNPKEVMIKSLEVACAFDAYLKTQELYHTKVSTDSDYQKTSIVITKSEEIETG